MVCVLVAAASSRAYGDREDLTIGQFGRWISDVRDRNNLRADSLPSEGKRCMEAVEALKKRGETVVRGDANGDYDYRFESLGGVANDRRSYDLPIAKAAGGSAPDDLRKYAKASTMFLWLSSDPDAAGYVTHTVRKFQFKGNTLVKTSDKTYRKKRGEQLGSSAFR